MSILPLPTGNRSRRLLFFAAALALLAGCGVPTDIENEYGMRRAARGAGSVNGVGVLADMFARDGHRVSSWQRLSPKIREADVIVWAPDSFEPPSEEQRRFLEDWVFAEDDRTLVYIGRDFDASIEYWKKMRTGAPAEQAQEVDRRLARARSRHDQARTDIGLATKSGWFNIETGKPKKKVQSLQGPWIDELKYADTPIDAAKVEIEIDARLAVPNKVALLDESGEFEVEELLVSGSDVLVSRLTHSAAGEWIEDPNASDVATDGDDVWVDDGYDDRDDDYYDGGYDGEYGNYPYIDTSRRIGDSQIIVVANGSFLLNLPLVNRQHRVLARKLIDTCDPYDESRNVVFLESGPYGPLVYEKEPRGRTGIEALTSWPLNVIILHALALGILFCFVFFPILGRPIDQMLVRVVDGRPIYAAIGSESTGLSDFGKHIDALGELLQKTEDAAYARARLNHYQQHVRRDSGVSHKAPPSRN